MRSCRSPASWRSGYAEDCKSLHPGSIPGEASKVFFQGNAGGCSSAARGRNPMATTTPAELDLERRLHMVNSQLRTGDVVDREVLAAFLETPRERFVAAGLRCARLPRSRDPGARRPDATAAAPVDAGADAAGGGRQGGRPGARRRRRLGLRLGAARLHGRARSWRSNPTPAPPRPRASCSRGATGVTVIEGPLAAGAAPFAPFDVIVVEGAFRVRPDALIAPARRRRTSGRGRRHHGRPAGRALRAPRARR